MAAQFNGPAGSWKTSVFIRNEPEPLKALVEGILSLQADVNARLTEEIVRVTGAEPEEDPNEDEEEEDDDEEESDNEKASSKRRDETNDRDDTIVTKRTRQSTGR